MIIGNWERMKWARGLGSRAFIMRAVDTGRNVAIFKVLVHVGPEIRVADSFVSFMEAEMP